jgi:hypothetical protein
MDEPEPTPPRAGVPRTAAPRGTVARPAEIYVLAALWAVKGFEELFRGVIGGAFFIVQQFAEGRLGGYLLHLAIQSALFAALMAAGCFYVMIALWLGRGAARGWGIALALVNELSVLAYLITRPPEFGGDIAIVRTVVIASIVNLGIVGVLLFDGKLARFLGSARLIGGWSTRR